MDHGNGNNLLPFREAITQLRQTDQQVYSLEVSTAELRLEDQGLHTPHHSWKRSAEGDLSLWKLARLPLSWIENQRRVGDEQLPVDVWNLVTGRLLQRNDLEDRCVVFIHDNRLVHISDDTLQTLTFGEVADAVEATLPRDLSDSDLRAHRLSITPVYFEFNIVAAKRQIEARSGDIVEAGISLLHFCTDQHPTQVTPYARRCVCDNGLIVMVHDVRQGPRVRRVPRFGGNLKNMVAQLQEVMRDAWAHVRPAMEQVQSLSERPLAKNGVTRFLEQMRGRYALTNYEINTIEAAIEEDELGPTGTVLDIVNGISRVGSHLPGLDLFQRRQLLRAGGDIAVRYGSLCRLCGSIELARRTIGSGRAR